MNRVFVDYLTDGRLRWQPIEGEYDHAVFNEGEAIDKFFALMQKAKAAGAAYMIVKVLPLWLMRVMVKLNLHKLVFGEYLKLSSVSLKEVLDDITTDKKLKAVLSYCFGDYGTPPSHTSFVMHAMLFNHFLRTGGFYPVGGASEIAYHMIPVVEEGGGAVLAGVKVDKVLVEDGEVFGVRVAKFDGMEIRAPVVISNAGAMNTFKSLLTPRVAKSYGLLDQLEGKKVGHACFQVFVGLEGTAKELGLVAKNYWVFSSYDQERYPGKSTCAIVTFSKYEWWSDWKDDQCQRRGN